MTSVSSEIVRKESTTNADRSAPESFALRAARTPRADAVVCGNAAISYAELDMRANALGAHLRLLGVGRDVVVGLCMERSIAAVTGALGIMMAGGAYLPIDPRHPKERLAFQLADAGADVVVTAAGAETIAQGEGWRVVSLAADGTLPQAQTAEALAADIRPEDLAYVIYTSGSTGRPKGVEITHGGLANLIAWHRAAFDVTDADRASHLSGVAFDAAVWEVWPYLAAGASVHVVDDGVAKEPEALRDWLLAKSITIGFTPTPMTERLMALRWPPPVRLRIMLTGADRLHHYPPASLPFQLVNNYGPTECSVVATSGIVPKDGHRDGLPPIGKPIANVTVSIVDEHQQPVRDGGDGEIWIGGRGVGRGYRNLSEVTAEKFLEDPFSASGGRIYRTGDRGRVLPDGQVVFLGRLDEQIKIRGFRVEPGEIEACLNEHPGIRESAVVARIVDAGDARLIAYVVPISRPPDAGEVRRFLAERLPDYMVPSAFAQLSSLPLNSSGKVDRAALRSHTVDEVLPDESYVAPRTPIEERLVGIVGPLLQLERVSVEDDFFMLGGHSLLGTQLIARLHDTFGVTVGLRLLFRSSTLAALATEVQRLMLLQTQGDGSTDRTSA